MDDDTSKIVERLLDTNVTLSMRETLGLIPEIRKEFSNKLKQKRKPLESLDETANDEQEGKVSSTTISEELNNETQIWAIDTRKSERVLFLRII